MKLFPDKLAKKSRSFRAFARIFKELCRFKVAVGNPPPPPFGPDSIQIFDNFGYMVSTPENRTVIGNRELAKLAYSLLHESFDSRAAMQQFSHLVKASQGKLIGGVIKVQNQRYVLDKYLCWQGNMFGSSSYQFFKYL